MQIMALNVLAVLVVLGIIMAIVGLILKKGSTVDRSIIAASYILSTIMIVIMICVFGVYFNVL